MVLLARLIDLMILCPLLLPHSLAAVIGRHANMTRLFPPKQDPWYQAPDSFAFAQRGEVMKIRHAPGNLTKKLKNLKNYDQILYRTSNADGDPSWAVTTVLAPKELAPNWLSAVSYQMPYSSVNLDESPSYKLSTAAADIRYDVLDRMLEKGWVVIIPDYQGPNSVFGAGKFAGRATLDSMRAFHSVSMSRFGLHYEKHFYIAWGYAGGALATAWAFLQKRDYASPIEFFLRSYALGGLLTDLPESIMALDGSQDAGMALSAIAGLMQEYPNVNDTIQLTAKTAGPFNISVFDALRTQSSSETMSAYAYHNLSDYFAGGLNEVISQLRGSGFDKEISLNTKLPPELPKEITSNFLFYHAINDKIASIADLEFLLKNNWCKKRLAIELQRNHEGGHEEARDAGTDAVVEWIARRFADLSKLTPLEMADDAEKARLHKPGQCYFHEMSAHAAYSDMSEYQD